MCSECQIQGMQRWLFFGRQMVREREESQKRYGEGQWKEWQVPGDSGQGQDEWRSMVEALGSLEKLFQIKHTR